MSQSMTSQLSAQTLTGALCVVLTPSHAPLSGAKRMVDMKRVLDNVLERLHGEFDSLLQQGPAMQDEDRCAGFACTHECWGNPASCKQSWLLSATGGLLNQQPMRQRGSMAHRQQRFACVCQQPR